MRAHANARLSSVQEKEKAESKALTGRELLVSSPIRRLTFQSAASTTTNLHQNSSYASRSTRKCSQAASSCINSVFSVLVPLLARRSMLAAQPVCRHASLCITPHKHSRDHPPPLLGLSIPGSDKSFSTSNPLSSSSHCTPHLDYNTCDVHCEPRFSS